MLPLAETSSRRRVTGFYGNYDGNIRNIAYGNTRVNGYEHYGVRGMVVADPTPDLTLTLIADYRKSDDDCCAEVIGTTPTNVTGAARCPTPRGDETRDRQPEPDHAHRPRRAGASRCRPTATLGTQTVTYISAYREYDNRRDPRRRLPAPGLCRLQPAARLRAADLRTPSPRNCG